MSLNSSLYKKFFLNSSFNPRSLVSWVSGYVSIVLVQFCSIRAPHTVVVFLPVILRTWSHIRLLPR